MKRISVIAPLYNEKDGIPMLARTLSELATRLAPAYELECVLVDDGSQDGTFEEVGKYFGWCPLVVQEKHAQNKGLGAAVRTGFGKASGDYLATIDSDCTFDPLQIPRMLDVLRRERVDVVTASPYHPKGGVENVAGWRLLLSRGASFLYRRLCSCKLYSYTSLLRVYRKEVIENVPFEADGFAATTEVLLRAANRGYRVAEVPMVLRTRAIGVSKMKVLYTIRTHIGLMMRVLWWRISDEHKSGSVTRTSKAVRHL
ncbi:MAG TPA: glycosyltransferase family 2 protein [Terriglobales bacterium]|nr:glycosyltransferase family 2 protein [Terriglobales bacterium]